MIGPGSVRFAQPLSNEAKPAIPPLPPPLTPQQVEKLSAEESADRDSMLAKWAIARWAGNTELYLKENPEMDFLARAAERQAKANDPAD